MSATGLAWADKRLTPLRDMHAADLLQRTARFLDRGADVTPEPLARHADGRLMRTPRLHLPFRRDLEVATAGGGVAHPRVDTPLDPGLDPRPSGVTAGEFQLSAAPFQWQAAELLLRGDPDGFAWAPLRLWFLEWMQPRMIEEAPELLGAVHSLSDPEPMRTGVRLRLDFGSAPPQCAAELLDALALTGAEAASIGPAPEAR
ncbi:hypothetical protein ACQ5SO_18155 [Rhodovulum sp. DZ06]|uniref:hypothetical protein n=1 Tax=Rhodovulum sp. DZ06 TaxID=3425126 RepID=UPI003D330598